METFYYKSLIGREERYTIADALLYNGEAAYRPLRRLLDVLRAKGILTGWDVCAVLGDGWEPCSSDAPPPWGTP